MKEFSDKGPTTDDKSIRDQIDEIFIKFDRNFDETVKQIEKDFNVEGPTFREWIVEKWKKCRQ